MPISHSHRCLFVHVPKTAGMSIMATMRRAGVAFELDGTGLWEMLVAHPKNAALLERFRRCFPLSTLRDFRQQHLPGELLRELVAAPLWSSYFKFAFVRNPWDLVVSTYHFQKIHANVPEHRHVDPDAKELINRCDDFASYVRLYPMVRSDMSSLIVDVEGRQLVDFVGRLERTDRGLNHVILSIGSASAASLVPREPELHRTRDIATTTPRRPNPSSNVTSPATSNVSGMRSRSRASAADS